MINDEGSDVSNFFNLAVWKNNGLKLDSIYSFENSHVAII